MGRNKIKIEKIKNDKIRQVTFNKRKRGLLKKAMELSLLCDVKCFLCIVDKTDQSMIYSSETDVPNFVNTFILNFRNTKELFSNGNYKGIFDEETQFIQYIDKEDSKSSYEEIEETKPKIINKNISDADNKFINKIKQVKTEKTSKTDKKTEKQEKLNYLKNNLDVGNTANYYNGNNVKITEIKNINLICNDSRINEQFFDLQQNKLLDVMKSPLSNNQCMFNPYLFDNELHNYNNFLANHGNDNLSSKRLRDDYFLNYSPDLSSRCLKSFPLLNEKPSGFMPQANFMEKEKQKQSHKSSLNLSNDGLMKKNSGEVENVREIPNFNQSGNNAKNKVKETDDTIDDEE